MAHLIDLITHIVILSLERFNKSGDCENSEFTPRVEFNIEFQDINNLNFGYKIMQCNF